MKNSMKSSGIAPGSTCAYTGTEADLYCEGGKYQFIGLDNKKYRITTTSDLLKKGTIVNFDSLSAADKVIISNIKTAFPQTNPPSCPKTSWWKPWVGRQLVVDLKPDLSGISIEMLTSDDKILSGEYTDGNLMTFGNENRIFTAGLHKYILRGELESDTGISVEFEVNIKATVSSV